MRSSARQVARDRAPARAPDSDFKFIGTEDERSPARPLRLGDLGRRVAHDYRPGPGCLFARRHQCGSRLIEEGRALGY